MQIIYLFRNMINLGLSSAGFLFCVAVTMAMTLTNYLSCQFSFELLGYDEKPLSFDNMVGPFLASYLEKAQLVNLYSFMVAVLLTMGLFFAFRISTHIFSLYLDRKYYLNNGDSESARIATHKIIQEFIWLAALAVPIYWAVHWDILLFRVRSIAGVIAAEDPQAMLELLNWEQQMERNGQMWAWQLTHLGAYGYLGITAIACLGLEYTMRKAGDHFRETTDRISAIFTLDAPQKDETLFYGYDENGYPVYDPNTPVVYDINGNPIGGESQDDYDQVKNPAGEAAANGYHQEATVNAPNTAEFDGSEVEDTTAEEVSHQEDTDAREALWDPAEGTQNEDFDTNSVSNSSVPKTERSVGATDSTEADAERTAEVIGGADGERVSFEAALADHERYWVDPNTYEVWDVNHRKELFGDDWRSAA